MTTLAASIFSGDFQRRKYMWFQLIRQKVERQDKGKTKRRKREKVRDEWRKIEC